MNRGILLLVALSAIGGPLLGCAGNSMLVTEKIMAGEKAVAAAREGSAESSAAEVKNAEEKLATARAAEREKEYVKAIRLAEEAQVDADYARARAAASRARKMADDMRADVKALKNEVESMPLQ